MATFISHSPEETADLGESWGREARCGWVIGLNGDLGAGKTQLVKGLARGLGIAARILSPTFALVNEYRDGRVPLFHIDLYRLESREQIMSAGLTEYLFRPPGVTVVEWCERWPDFRAVAPSERQPPTPTDNRFLFRRVLIEPTNETQRRISYEDFGA